MNAKIQKIELFTLFLLSLISVLAFYFGTNFNDNVFQITSSSNSTNFFTYYFSSFVVYIGYFSGPWLLPAFFIHSLVYAFIFSKRDFTIDSLLIIPIVGVCLFSSYIFFPVFVGDGLGLILRQEVGIFLALFFNLLCISALFAGIFRARFKDSIINGCQRLCRVPSGFFEWKQKITHKDPMEKYRNATTKRSFSLGKFIRIKLPSILKGNTARVSKTKIEAHKGFEFSNVLKKKERPEASVDNTEPLDSIDNNLSENEQILLFNDNYRHDQNISTEISKVNFAEQVSESENENDLNENPDSKQRENDRKLLIIERKRSNDFVDDSKKYASIVSCLKENRTPTLNDVPNEYFGEIIQILETKLSEFDIGGQIVNVMKGPVVDTFELELGPGIKVSKVSNRSDDLSLALKGVPVRIVYPMEGKTTVGIEVPRDPREIIYLDQIINDSIFERNNCALPIAMGKDAFGDVMIEDLAKMPHMLVAGATGSGKSVFVNTLLISLLVKKNPHDLKLILIDPKQLELALYHELPHLALPVITEPKIAAVSLLWAVQEMERRYSIMKEFGVRSIDGFNEKLSSATPEMLGNIHHYYDDGAENEGYHLPYVVIIIDEFADLMLTKSGKEIEIYVNRLAAKARAAGIHLVVATQRPSVKVITGNIKSNFPSRVSFKVISGIDSRTILDSQGAEKLLGMGDMLFSRGVTARRAHSAYISDAQVGELVTNLSKISSSFLPSAMAFLENGGGEDEPGEVTVTIGGAKGKLDDRYEEAMEIARQKGVVSASMLQRTMGIGYPKAAKIVDQMEENGAIGPARGSKPREVLT